jgi:hypothetical protein
MSKLQLGLPLLVSSFHDLRGRHGVGEGMVASEPVQPFTIGCHLQMVDKWWINAVYTMYLQFLHI